MKTLFLCVGNVGRSQMAEALATKLNPGAEVSSAGVRLSGPEQPIVELLPKTKEVIDVMKEEGVDVSKNKRKQLTPEMIEAAEKVVLIVEDGECELPDYLISSPKLIRWSIPDPKGQDLEFTRKVKDEIKAKVATLFDLK